MLLCVCRWRQHSSQKNCDLLGWECPLWLPITNNKTDPGYWVEARVVVDNIVQWWTTLFSGGGQHCSLPQDFHVQCNLNMSLYSIQLSVMSTSQLGTTARHKT